MDAESYKDDYLKCSRLIYQNRTKFIFEKIKIKLRRKDSIYSTWYEWSLCNVDGYNKHFSVLLKDLYDNCLKYEEVFGILSDESSQRVFTDICEWRYTRNSTLLIDAFSVSENKQYLEPFELLRDNEVFVDCGGYIGDSSMDLISYAGGVEKIYLYEADEKNISEAKKNLAGTNTVFRNVGVSDKAEELVFCGLGLSSSGFTNQSENGTTTVKTVSIDEDIPMTEAISFIKMDIEGMEKKALIGATQHISKDRPVLAVCLYHNPWDLWELPLYIKSITKDDYCYYMRHYTTYHGETVFYAVPKERMNEK